jgi:2,3-bisphosphoglycerate-dependent phosphoglycerate mutase
MVTLALLRHGQSLWNLENRFTGWVDVDLSPRGEEEAIQSGQLLARCGVEFDKMHTSVLTRAIRTGHIALEQAKLLWLPVEKSWRLNERHYGALTGLNKAETAERHGAEQVKIWRRSYDTPPPPLEPGGEYDFAKDRRYAGVANLPRTESLKTTLERVLPYWNDAIAPDLRAGLHLIVAAHGNSLRAIMKHLFAMSDDAVVGLEMPTGNTLLLELDAALKPISARYLDEARAEKIPALPA